MLSSSPDGFEVRYVGPAETLQLEASSFVGATLYAQPGGDTSTRAAYRSLGMAGQEAIRNFVAAGGRYLGICQGAYLAGSRYSGLGLLSPGDAGWYVGTRGAEHKVRRSDVIPTRWGSHTHHMYFQDGPYLIPSQVPGEKILARYTNGRAAVLVRPYGAGRSRSRWATPRGDQILVCRGRLARKDPDGIDTKLGYRIINQVMRGAPGH